MKRIVLLFTIALFFSAVSLFAQNAKTRLENGKQLFEKRDYDAAIQELTEAIKLNPKLAEAYAYRARAYNGKDDYDRGLYDSNEAIRLNKKLAMGYFARGSSYYYGKEDYDRAIADFNEAIKLDPKFANAYTNRGIVFSDKNEYDRAIADFNEVIKLDPKAYAYTNRGLAYSNKNDYDRAIADYNEAIKLDLEFAYAYFFRGLAYSNKNDYDRAIADFNEALRIDPNFTDAKEKLQEETGVTNNQDDFVVRQNTQGGITITGYKGIRQKVIIPDTLYGQKVTEIGSGAFSDKNLTKITIPNTVTYIRFRAFNGNTRLTEIVLPDALIEIEASAFLDCNLSNLRLGSKIQKIGMAAFGRNNISTLVITSATTNFEAQSLFGQFITTPFDENPLTRVTLPTNMSDNNVKIINFDLGSYYISQGKKAGTYVKNGPVWNKE